MSYFDSCFEQLVIVEGKYSNDPDDSGGATMYGVTEEVARNYGYHGAMSALPLSLTKTIYRKEYWDPAQLDAVAALSLPIAYEVFDSGVNCGVQRAVEWLQRGLNALNNGGDQYEDLPVSGLLRERTLQALKTYLKFRGTSGEQVLLRALNSLQGVHYITLAERRPKDERFVYGWFQHRVVI